jgi:hypothetical protein
MPGSLEPQRIGDRDWYYEYPKYMLLVHEVRKADGTFVCADSIKIPWRKIETSLKRSYKPAKDKGRKAE